MADVQRISIGFQAAPPVALRVSGPELERLHGALGGEGWHEVQSEDGALRLNLQFVLWVRTEKDESRVGFGLG